MDDNVYMEPCCASSRSNGNAADTGPMVNGSTNGYDEFGEAKSWHCSHIIDFSNLSIGKYFLLNSICVSYCTYSVQNSVHQGLKQKDQKDSGN